MMDAQLDTDKSLIAIKDRHSCACGLGVNKFEIIQLKSKAQVWKKAFYNAKRRENLHKKHIKLKNIKSRKNFIISISLNLKI